MKQIDNKAILSENILLVDKLFDVLGVGAKKKRKELGRKDVCQVCGIKKVLVIDDWQKICYDEECQKHID